MTALPMTGVARALRGTLVDKIGRSCKTVASQLGYYRDQGENARGDRRAGRRETFWPGLEPGVSFGDRPALRPVGDRERRNLDL